MNEKKELLCAVPQRVDKPSHSVSVLRFGAHECQIRSAPMLVLPRAAKVSNNLRNACLHQPIHSPLDVIEKGHDEEK
ncbi:hypothetical protein EX219_04320 [Bacillus aerophilus]|nr:hypothetical protein [Bacillus aerophilus]MBX7015930.1 hypothetical protein [Bacillus aerophilus]